MSVKSVLKKKFKIKNPISSLKKRKQKNKINTLEPSVDTYNKLDVDNLKNDHSIPDKVKNKILVTDETSTVVDGSVTKMSKKRKSVDTVDESEPSKKKSSKKRVTFAADVKSETDQKCTAGNMIPSSLNKRKKLNYIKKLKAKKNKQKNAKKCEENATAASTPRQERAVEYLMEWKNDRSNWKFKKIDQLWLIKNTYDSVKISKEHFDILVEYLQTIEGKCRSLILQTANSIVSESSASNEQKKELNSSQKIKYQRARTIIQMFG